MKIDYLTLFPDMFNGVLNHSILKRAQEKDVLQVNTVDFRHFAENKHNQVDDYPYGGGQGMVLKPEPIFNAMDSIDKTADTRVILMCPQGRPFNQDIANEL
ncbi:tRNA (guanosine(37)-N1)-methyltransferase TrmD, partial [Staphylococcus xylosus]|nr:tRNA (guanosine(37)-N1)-methyltransferase TrmD [Staphylococcus xylosus]